MYYKCGKICIIKCGKNMYYRVVKKVLKHKN